MSQEVNEQLDAILGGSTDGDLAKWVTDLVAKKAEAKTLDDACDVLQARIISKMKELGSTGMVVAGRRIGLSSRTYYGIVKEKMEAFKSWMLDIAPEAYIPASTNVAKAVEVFMEKNPGSTLPDFVAVTEKETFTNSKA